MNIPENTNRSAAIAQANAEHQANLEKIAKRILERIADYGKAEICCSVHMIGIDAYPLDDVIEVMKQFSAKGYFCYYRCYTNNHGVDQREAFVAKEPHDLNRDTHHKWHEV